MSILTTSDFTVYLLYMTNTPNQPPMLPESPESDVRDAYDAIVCGAMARASQKRRAATFVHPEGQEITVYQADGDDVYLPYSYISVATPLDETTRQANQRDAQQAGTIPVVYGHTQRLQPTHSSFRSVKPGDIALTTRDFGPIEQLGVEEHSTAASLATLHEVGELIDEAEPVDSLPVHTSLVRFLSGYDA